MVRRDQIGADALGKMMRKALGQSTRVDKNQRRSMLLNERGKAVIDLAPKLVRRDRTDLAAGNLNRQVQLTPRRHLNDDRTRPSCAGKESRDRLDRFLCRRKSDPRERSVCQRVEALE